MEPFFIRYRNLIVLMLLLVVQIIGLAMQVRRGVTGRTTYDTADSSGVRLIRLWANWVVSPPERAVEHSKTGVGWIWQNYIDLRHVRQQNSDLQNTIDRLRLEQAALLEDARQGQRLQAMLNFQQKYLYKTMPAQVIGASGSDQSRVFYLDKGKNDGLARDMAVITAEGIVGKVREVFPHSAQVLAINDQSSGAGVILEATRIRGILRGNAEGQPQIVGILADQRIQPGEKVLTAGGDQIFPRGLPVGVVDKVVTDPDRDGFIDIVVKPAAYLDRLDEVLVITATEPKFAPDQQKDLETSESLKGAEAAALAEQRKASAIMAERLPGLTDPTTAAGTAAKPGDKAANPAPGANGASPAPAAIPVPKIIPPQHPDRFTPGHREQPADGSGPAPAAGHPPTPKSAPTAPPSTRPASPAAKAADTPAEKTEKPAGAPDTAEPQTKPPANPDSPQRQRKP
jgi:rod shape-determining protein MreC